MSSAIEDKNKLVFLTTFDKETTSYGLSFPSYAMICSDKDYSGDNTEAQCYKRVVKLVVDRAPYIVVNKFGSQLDVDSYKLLATAFNYDWEQK